MLCCTFAVYEEYNANLESDIYPDVSLNVLSEEVMNINVHMVS